MVEQTYRKILARSLAGHDRGTVFCVVGETEDAFLLADGKGRTLAEPKKKNRRHVQPIRALPGEVRLALDAAERDSDLVHVLRLYAKAGESLEGR